MNKTENTDCTVVKNEFPNGWKETPFEPLFKRLEENGFKTANQGELSADEPVMDARPHSDLYKIEKDGRYLSFVMNATRNLRNGDEILDSIGGFKNISNKIDRRVKFEIPPDGDVDGKCAAVEYRVGDLVNHFYGRPVERRNFNHQYRDKVRREECAELKAKSEARFQDHIKHPDKYFGPPVRLVEPPAIRRKRRQGHPNDKTTTMDMRCKRRNCRKMRFLEACPFGRCGEPSETECPTAKNKRKFYNPQATNP